ncbi:MAG: glycoside hydrolase family 105 protein [Sphaerochaeta sp.]|jgi:rhamnogalacturonyl hydrolase YesR|uniref:glycoside hydrolase family 88/105 protein n=1 Tax=Sphaerochaeta sp. TaxID=1972642 RepID=UPI003D0BF34F
MRLDRIRRLISSISDKYVHDNPAVPLQFLRFRTDGFYCNDSGHWMLDVSEKLPDAENGQFSYIMARTWRDKEESIDFYVRFFSPCWIYLNGRFIYKSDPIASINPRIENKILLTFHEGWNVVCIRVQKTSGGFGLEFGPSNPKWFWCHFLAPFLQRPQEGGWVYSETVDVAYEDLHRRVEFSPDESSSGLHWFPLLDTAGNGGRLPERHYLVRTRLSVSRRVHFHSGFSGNGARKAYLDGQEIKKWPLVLEMGDYDLVAYDSGLDFLHEVSGILCINPLNPRLDTPWVFSLLVEGESMDLGKLDMRVWYEDSRTVMRPYVLSERYGIFNYPVGVTLYGLLNAALHTTEKNLIGYIVSHVRECVMYYRRSLKDKELFGYPEMNHHIVNLKVLDDCGSFGNLLLELLPYISDPLLATEIENLLEVIACFMHGIQERLPDGVFYRKGEPEYLENTLWADDTFMSIPFLAKYAVHYGRPDFLDDAVRQLELFDSYLWMDDRHLYSHVYEVKKKVQFGVPWGRGNGWVLFTSVELLSVLDDEHPGYERILSLYKRVLDGWLVCQIEDGMFPQVLDRPDSYHELSATAMFVYAASKGLRKKWVSSSVISDAVKRAVGGMMRGYMSEGGDIFGVSAGSACSYSDYYYMYELPWKRNDTHGIGVVLLALCEFLEYQETNDETCVASKA